MICCCCLQYRSDKLNIFNFFCSLFIPDPFGALGMASEDIPDSAITASSAHQGLPAVRGRLYSTKYGDFTAWGSGVVNTNQWLRIDLSKVRFVTAVATQGRHFTPQWVKSYWLSYSTDGTIFSEYKDQNQIRKVLRACWLRALEQNKICFKSEIAILAEAILHFVFGNQMHLGKMLYEL